MEELSVNLVDLCGVIAETPVYSHTSRGERFYSFPLEICRLSGAADKVNIIIRSDLLSQELNDSEKLRVIGELRSFNNKHGDGAKLVISVFAKQIFFCDEPDSNSVSLTGTLCKQPNLRTTPMGRDICDLMIAVNRKYGRSDYLPCITWGLKARQSSQWAVGDKVHLEGRIQSRNYIKLTDGETFERTAFEVSVVEISKL